MSISSISGRIKQIEKRIFPKRRSEPDSQILKAIVNIDNALNGIWAKFNETQRALWVLRFNEEPNQISYEDSLMKAQEATERYDNYKNYIKANSWPSGEEIRAKLLSGIVSKENIQDIETLIDEHKQMLGIKEDVPVIEILSSIFGDSLRYGKRETECGLMPG